MRQVVFKGKLKLFYPCSAGVKKFKFVWVNHKFDQRGHNKNHNWFVPLICPYIVYVPYYNKLGLGDQI